MSQQTQTYLRLAEELRLASHVLLHTATVVKHSLSQAQPRTSP
jgi:hypothetical protein